MKNEDLAKTIMDFLLYANKAEISPMHIFINPHDERNMFFIGEWIDEVWAKEQL